MTTWSGDDSQGIQLMHMMDRDKALASHDGTSPDLAQLLSMDNAYNDHLVSAGHAANAAFRHDVFADFRETCRPNTLRRHDYDLRAFSAFLASCGRLRERAIATGKCVLIGANLYEIEDL
jgi:hypothetical protein